MAGEWHCCTWGDAISLEYGKALRGHEGSTGRYRVFGSNGPIGWTDQPLTQGPGVILGRKGAYRGVEFSRAPFHVIDTAYYVLPRMDLDMRWLYYAVKHYRLGEIDDGSPIPSTTRAAVYVQELEIPPLPEQKRIAHVLGTLDDKIDLNRRMNATLEAMSRAIFKSWFVDFDPVRQKAAGKQPVGMDVKTATLFPDSFEDSEIGEVPKGWRVAEVRDFLSLSRDSLDPSEHPAETFDHFSIPAFDSGRWPSPDTGAGIKSQKLLVAPGSVLISKLNPQTPRVWIPQEQHQRRRVASTEFLVAIPNEITGAGVPFVFCFASSEGVVDYLTSHASGTSNSHQRVRPDDFLSLRSALPPPEVLREFEAMVSPLLRRSSQARGESRSLATLRDALLPKLLSGEIRVPEAEGMVEEAIG